MGRGRGGREGGRPVHGYRGTVAANRRENTLSREETVGKKSRLGGREKKEEKKKSVSRQAYITNAINGLSSTPACQSPEEFFFHIPRNIPSPSPPPSNFLSSKSRRGGERRRFFASGNSFLRDPCERILLTWRGKA